MKTFRVLFLLFVSFSILVGCGKDDETPTCEGLLNNGGTMKIDGEDFNLSLAQLLVTEGFDGDNYQFQVGGLTDNCNELKSLSFLTEITTNSDFSGTYNIVDFFDAGLNDVTAVSFTSSNVSNGQQSQMQINSGTMTVNKVSSTEYEVDMTGNVTGGGSIDISFRSEF